jgi:molecular chaperone HtpG
MSHLTEFDGKQFASITRGDLDLGNLDDEESKKEQEASEKEVEGLIERVKTALGDKVKEVRFTHRLTDSPACVVADEHDMSSQMQKLMEQIGQKAPETKPVFELNPEHQLVKHLNNVQDEDNFAQWADVLLDQALLAERGSLKDPAGFVSRLNKLMLDLSK